MAADGRIYVGQVPELQSLELQGPELKGPDGVGLDEFNTFAQQIIASLSKLNETIGEVKMGMLTACMDFMRVIFGKPGSRGNVNGAYLCSNCFCCAPQNAKSAAIGGSQAARPVRGSQAAVKSVSKPPDLVASQDRHTMLLAGLPQSSLTLAMYLQQRPPLQRLA